MHDTDIAGRRAALDAARSLVAVWSPSELPILDILEERFVLGLEDPAPTVGKQEFGLEFMAGMSCAAAILYLFARGQHAASGVRTPIQVPLEAQLLVSLRFGHPPHAPPPRDGLIVRALGAAFMECWPSPERARMACREAGVPAPDVAVGGDVADLWMSVVTALHAREDWSRLHELVIAALEERGDDERLRCWRVILGSAR